MANLDMQSVADAQFDAFVQDCLIPRVKGKTQFKDIFNTYNTYCQAIQQEPFLTKAGLSRRLTPMYMRRFINGVSYYSLDIRDNLFVREGDTHE